MQGFCAAYFIITIALLSGQYLSTPYNFKRRLKNIMQLFFSFFYRNNIGAEFQQKVTVVCLCQSLYQVISHESFAIACYQVDCLICVTKCDQWMQMIGYSDSY